MLTTRIRRCVTNTYLVGHVSSRARLVSDQAGAWLIG